MKDRVMYSALAVIGLIGAILLFLLKTERLERTCTRYSFSDGDEKVVCN